MEALTWLGVQQAACGQTGSPTVLDAHLCMHACEVRNDNINGSAGPTVLSVSRGIRCGAATASIKNRSQCIMRRSQCSSGSGFVLRIPTSPRPCSRQRRSRSVSTVG